MSEKSVRQLIAGADSQIEFYPKQLMQNVLDGEAGENLYAYLSKFNHINVGYVASASAAYNAIPEIYRKPGFIITYYLNEKPTTKQFIGTKENAGNDNWLADSYWQLVDGVGEVESNSITLNQLSKEVLDLLSQGNNNIVNYPDGEDLTEIDACGGNGKHEINVLKFADKKYNSANFSGLGRKYLRKNLVEIDQEDGTKVTKNVLTQEMINAANTRYIIQYDYDLNEETIIIPEGCVLDFQGGSFSNGVIDFEDTIFNNIDINILGINRKEGLDDTDAINKYIKANINSGNYYIKIPKGDYYVSINEDNDSSSNININLNYNNSYIVDFEDSNIKVNPTKNRYYRVINISLGDVTIKNLNLQGDRLSHDYTTISGTHEFGYGISIEGNNVKANIEHCIIHDCTGDGIFSFIKNNGAVTIKNVDIYKCRRQGISVLRLPYILIDSCNIHNIGTSDNINGAAPMSAIDLEPASLDKTINTCIIQNSYLEGIKSLVSSNNVEELYIDNCNLKGQFLLTHSTTKKTYICNCTITNNDYQAGMAIDSTTDKCIINNCTLNVERFNLRGVFNNCTFNGSDDVEDNRLYVYTQHIVSCVFNNIKSNGNYGVAYQKFNDKTPLNSSVEFNNCTVSYSKKGQGIVDTDELIVSNDKYNNCKINVPRTKISFTNCDFVNCSYSGGSGSYNEQSINIKYCTFNYGENSISLFQTANKIIEHCIINGKDIPANIFNVYDSKIRYTIFNIIDELNIYNIAAGVIQDCIINTESNFTQNVNLADRFKNCKLFFNSVEKDVNINDTARMPTSPIKGQQFINTTLKRLIWFDGENWRTVNGEVYNIPEYGNTSARPVPNSRNYVFYDLDLRQIIFYNGLRWINADGTIPAIKRGTTANRPQLNNDSVGFVYFDTTLSKPIWWTGSEWVDATGANI